MTDQFSKMKSVSVSEMQAMDRMAIQDYGIPGIVLMEHAGHNTAAMIRTTADRLACRSFVIICGKGNNAGDGFVIARWLAKYSCQVQVVHLFPESAYQGDAATNLNIILKMNLKVIYLPPNQESDLSEFLSNDCMIVDAIFGTGFRPPMDARMTKVINLINASGKPVTSVDIPSGLCAETFELEGESPCIKAKTTVTLGRAKDILCEDRAQEYVGHIELVDIGIPDCIAQQFD